MITHELPQPQPSDFIQFIDKQPFLFIIFSNSLTFQAKPMSQYKNIIDEQDYCDQSDLLISEYENSSTLDFEAELQFINKWLADETNAPLVIVGDGESGKKSLLCSFLKMSKSVHQNWLHLCHFASITPHYSHILYKIMIELRNYYKIEQRVDLNDEKLRRYFKYWLEVVSDLIEKEYLGYVKTEIPKVVVIIEGIDECFDSKGNLVDTEFWLPHEIPKNIKLILTTKCLRQGEISNATVLRHHLSQEKKEKIMERFVEKTRLWASKSNRLSLYHMQVIDKMVRIKPNFQSNCNSIQEITQEYISSISANGFSSQEMKSLLYILTLTRKGLKSKWIQKIVNITQEKWGLFLRYFSFFIVESGSYYIICNKSSRNIIKDIADRSGEKEKTYRQTIAHSLRNQAVHLRELEEVVYQLYLSESYIELKEVISRVENFAMLYTPLSKDLLCECWVKLEQLEQYDPVFEYNKAIQAYKSHYYPKEEDLYKIIFQISMFFKEYAEFQNARTPEFRHPLIKGEMDQLVQIGIYEELKSLAMIGKCKVYKLKPLEKFTAVAKKNETNSESKKDKEKPNDLNSKEDNQLNNGRRFVSKNKLKQKKEHNKPRESQSSVSDPLRPDTSSSKGEEELPEQPLNIEQINVSIQANQQKFRNVFTNSMKEYLENYFTPLKKCAVKEKQLSFQSDESENQDEQSKERLEKEPRIDTQKLKQSLLLKKFREYLEESYHKTGEQVRFYYYKQWIWLQFPWICQTVKNIYSQMIKECLPGSIHFMSPIQEFKFVREVLKIARNAKESKMSIFTEKKIEILPLKYSPQKLGQLETQRKTRAFDEVSTVSKTRRTQEVEAVKPCINLSTIDQLIISEKQYERTFKDKSRELSKGFRGQASSPNFNTFVTQTQSKSKLLPSLNKSKFAKQSRGQNRQKQNLNETKDYTLIIRKYNEIKHDNDMMIQKIEEMKKLSSIQMSKTREEHDYIIFHIRNIEDKKEVLEKNFNQQSLLQKKLEVIIKICDLNKMYGSESEYLSTYLASLKQMILLEENRVRQVKNKIADFLERSKGEIKELRRKRKDLKTAKDQHDRMYINLGSESTNPQYKSMPLEEIEQELREMQKSVKIKTKRGKSKIQHYLSSDDYELIEEKLGFLFGDINNQAKLKQFSDKSEKKKQLHLRNNELSQEIKLRKESLLNAKQKLKNLKEVSLNEKRLSITNSLIDSKKLLNHTKQRSLLISNAIQTLTQK